MKKKSCFSLVMAVLFTMSAVAQLSVQQLRTENLDNPVGIDILYPRFSWQLAAETRNTWQTAYALTVSDAANPAQAIWQSGKKTSDRSVYVPYEGPQLQGGKKYRWKVTVWDNHGNTAVSDIAFFQMGLLTAHDWKAKWIEPGYTEDSIQRPSPLFRKTFSIKRKLVSATAYITAHGLYEARLNGKRIGDSYLTPGWTSYRKRLQYQAYDVTDLVVGGDNVLGVTLGSGWYRGYIAFANNHNYYGKDIALLMQVDMVFSDGTSESIITDESWKSNTGSIRSSEIYHGETIDARQEKQGWLLDGYDDAGWYGVKTAVHPMNILVATDNEPVKKQEVFHPVKIFNTPAGEQVIDFGQNLVGWVVLKVNGKPGDSIVVSHAEVLDKAGNFYTTNLRAAKAQDTYILKGGGEETFEPHFTWHGFRYIRVYGYPGELKPENFTAVALYSGMQQTGSFHTSNTMINQLQKNIVWGQKGNFLDVPTDCPQRDERLGWTGDAQVFSRTASFNMNVHNFFSKWLHDVAADQQPDGSVPHVVPNVLGAGAAASAGWADVATIIPWNMYLAYGDTQLLGNQYASMKAWVDYMQHKSKNDLWNTGSHFGDWLFYRPDDDNSGRAAVTDKYLIAQCFYAYSTQMLMNAARVLGRQDDVTFYTGLLERIRTAFRNEYVTGNGRLVSGTQTAYVLALNFDMLPEAQRSQAVQRLIENIGSYGNHLTTGFLGTPYLCHVLSRYGHTDIAYRLLLQDTYPSWLYPVKMGATTIWERWDGIKPDGSFQVPSMNSYNHYAYGAIGDWMYRVMAGLDTEEDGPGYKHIRIQPHTGGGFTEVKASLQTYYGKLSGNWKIQDGTLLMDVEVPVNTKATVYIPATGKASITESGSLVKNGRQEKDYRVIELGSGKYHFTVSR
jgi:alpha-L-rhamnosidase